MKQDRIIFFVKIISLMLMGFISLSQAQTDEEESFLLVSSMQQHFSFDSLQYEPYLKIDQLEIFRTYRNEGVALTAHKALTCREVPLAQPMDSVLALTFHTSRKLRSGILKMQMDDTCRITVLRKPEFKVSALPVKELNMFLSSKIVQDEIYIDFDLPAIVEQNELELRQILLFEFLFQEFLMNRIARGRVFSKSYFAELIDDSRPVYAPELHFYLDGPAANALIKNWENIKRTFKNQLYSNGFQKQVEQFTQKLHLINSSGYGRLIGFSKMLLKYGSYAPIQFASIESSREDLDRLRQNISSITDHLIVYWFKPGVLDEKMLETLRSEIGDQNLLIFKE